MTGSSKMPNTISKVFIVGMARSGTTLVQSILHNHSDIISFPETHFLSKTIFLPRYLRLAPISTSSVRYVNNFLERIGVNGKVSERLRFSKVKYVREVCQLFDEHAASAGCSIWVEKTPLHLLFIDLLEGSIPSAKFIHVIRNPEDTINSLLKASRNHKAYFAQNTITKAIDRYLRDAKESLKQVDKENHYFINYNKLIDDKKGEVQKLCDFLSIDYQKDMLNANKAVDHLITEEEEWKSNNRKDIAKTGSENILTSKEKEEIRLKTDSVWSQWQTYFEL